MSLSEPIIADNDTVLTHMQTGMTVYDVNRRAVGIVASIYLSGLRSLDSSTSSAPMISTIAGTFVENRRMPELLVVRLGRTGFAKVTPTLERMWADYYITPQQVLTVKGNRVFLKVPFDVLIRH